MGGKCILAALITVLGMQFLWNCVPELLRNSSQGISCFLRIQRHPKREFPLSEDVLYHLIVKLPLMVSTDVPAEDAPISELYHLHAKRHRPRSSLFVYIVYYSHIVSHDLNIQGMDEWQDSFAGFVYCLQFYVNLGLLLGPRALSHVCPDAFPNVVGRRP